MTSARRRAHRRHRRTRPLSFWPPRTKRWGPRPTTTQAIPSGQTGGFTTVLPPNTGVSVIFNGQEYDADFNSRQEGSSATVPTYAAVTSRSYHTGGVVNVAMMDGSVRSVTKGISQAAWRAVGTRAGGEILGLD